MNVQTVCRETDHSPEAVLRYTTNFKQVNYLPYMLMIWIFRIYADKHNIEGFCKDSHFAPLPP